jgi:ATP-dependent helicase/nuclease subunit A
MTELTPEQRHAVERRDGPLMVRAGAGTGKTTVLVERFVRAVTRDDVPVEAILAITFTEKAAAEMKGRVRRRLLEEGRRELARAAENAWISTIHAFCSSVLRAHALSAGVDPAFRVLDQLESERLAVDAFDAALEAFMSHGDDPARIEMVAAYTPDRLRDMVRTAFSHLRSRGQRHPRLDETYPPERGGELARLGPAARSALAELGAVAASAAISSAIERLERALVLADRLDAGELPEPAELDRVELKRGNAKALSTHACRDYRDALAAVRALAVAEREHRDHTMLRALVELYDGCYERVKRARSGLDFEDLELITRDLLVTHEGLRLSYAERFAHILVDEFQDTNPLQNELLGLLARGNLFRVGDENQSIYRFRNADVGVFREHWESAERAGEAASITVNFRSRPELIDAIDLGFERIWGADFEPLRAAPGTGAKPPVVEPCVELIVVDRAPKR